ncbi:MAG: multicopper oxidase domain-containing protein [Bacteroidota bacterium]
MRKILLLACFLPTLLLKAQNPLSIPDTLSGNSITLTIRDSVRTWYPGFPTNTIGINAAYLGPTLLLNKGDSILFSVQNQLMDSTTLHWHGLHIPPEDDGGPHTPILPLSSWNPAFTVMDAAGTYWYHPHLHMRTAEHVTKGAAGLIIIRDSTEAQLNLPRRYAVDDFPLVIQSRAFDGSRQFIVETAADSVILVNGTLDPLLQVPAQVVRLRLLNGSTDRVYNLGLQNNQVFYQIGSDGGLLNQPVPMSRLRLAPGERAEILVNLSGMQGQQVYLVSYGSELPDGIYGALNPSSMGMGSIPGYSANLLNGSDFNIVLLDVTNSTTNPVTSIPATLVSVTPYSSTSANLTFPVTIAPQVMGPNGMLNGPFELNGSLFDMNVINHTTSLGYTEIWTIQNNTAIAHPFHVHGLQFYIFERNGLPPPANEAGRKDVVLVYAQETVKIIMRFEDFVNDSVPYMYHCHMLTHEEDGMMGQYIVSGPSSAPEYPLAYGPAVYPNPSSGLFTIALPDMVNGQAHFHIQDVLGKPVYKGTIALKGGEGVLHLAGLPEGAYFLTISHPAGSSATKIFITR